MTRAKELLNLTEEQLYYPCITDPYTGHISKPVGKAMSKDKAEQLLKDHYWSKWLKAEAIPQPKEMIDKGYK